MSTVCVSWVPASENDVLRLIGDESDVGPVGTFSGFNVGATLLIVTCAVEIVGGLNGSLTLSCAVNTASSLHVMVGVNVFTAVGVQTVPAFALVMLNVQASVKKSFSASNAV